MVANSAVRGSPVECFDGLFPKLLFSVPENNEGSSVLHSVTASEALDSIFLGGMT